MQGDVRGMCVLNLQGQDGTRSLRSEHSDGPTLPPAERPVSVINIYKAYFKSRASHQSRSSSEAVRGDREREKDTENEDRERVREKGFDEERERESNGERWIELERESPGRMQHTEPEATLCKSAFI